MIDKHIKTLNKVRKKEISISDYLYKEGKDHEGYSCDLNCDKRYHLLIALQYDRKESDEEILEQLMKAEIEMHRNASFQGLHTSMRLNAFLLSKFNRPEYSLLFMRAKESNFDTHCGFDSEHLVGAGINETYNYLQTIKHNKIAQGIFELIGSTSADCYYTETEIKECKNNL